MVSKWSKRSSKHSMEMMLANSFLGKRSTPFGQNIEQKEYSFWSQNRAKGVVNIHFCHFWNSFLGKRSTPFGYNIEQRECSFCSQNRAKGVVNINILK